MKEKEILKEQLKNQYALMLNEKDIDTLLNKIKANNGVDGIIDSILFYDDVSSFYDDNFELISQYLDSIYKNISMEIKKSILEDFNLEDVEKILNKQNIDDEQDSEDIKSILVWFILEKLAGL